MTTCWDILGLALGADERAIKSAYARAVREHPPEGDPAAFQRVREAYERALAEEAPLVVPPAGLFASRIPFGGLGGDLFRQYVFEQGVAFGKQAAQARDARACLKCGAALGAWCKPTADGRPTICKERLCQ